MRRPVYDHTFERISFAHATAVLRGDPANWLPEPAARRDDGFVVTMRAAGLMSAPEVDAIVSVEPTTIDRETLFVRPIAWRAASADRLFPTLTADLEIEAVNGTAIRFALVGSYRPPVSVVGEAADRLIGHHIAEAVVRTFLEGVAERMNAAPVKASTLGA
jgi:hypothetical protein